MPRRLSRKEQQAETRRRLLVAASRVFAANGYHGASVSKIVEEAGFTTGALYSNFENKEQLFLEMIDEQISGQVVELEEMARLGDGDLILEKARIRVEQLVSGLTDPGDVLTPTGNDARLSTIQVQTLTLEFLLFAVRGRPDLLRQIAERYRTIEAHIAEVFRTMLRSQGRNPTITPEELATVQSWIIEGLGLRLLQDPELVTPARAADLYEQLIYGLVSPADSAPT